MKQLYKKLLIFITVFSLVISALPAWADSPSTDQVVMKFRMNVNSYTVNGVSTSMDVGPAEIAERAFLPVAYVTGPLGIETKWDNNAQKVTVLAEGKTMELWIRKNRATINGSTVYIDPSDPGVKPLTINGRTMLPLRFVAENLGCDVVWDAATSGITISKGLVSASDEEDEIKKMKEEIEKMKRDQTKKEEQDKIKEEIRRLEEKAKQAQEEAEQANQKEKQRIAKKEEEDRKKEEEQRKKEQEEQKKRELSRTKTVDTLAEADMQKPGFYNAKNLGKGYDIFGEFGAVASTKHPVLDFNKLLEYNWIQGKYLGSDIKHDTIIAESLKEYCTEMSNRTKVSGSYMGFSGSAEVNFGETRGESESRYHATHMYSRSLYDFYIPAELMNASFAQFLNPDAKKAINEAPVHQLFSSYGHYVLMGLKTGGRADINVSTESSTVYGKDDFALKVKAGYDAIVGSVDAENEYKKSTAYKNFASKSRIGIRIVGNNHTVFLRDFLEGSNKLTDWEKNIESRPTMIGFSNTTPQPLIPIWMFADTEQRRNQIKAEFDKIAGEIERKIPGSKAQPKNYLYGIRLGRGNEGMEDAIERVTSKSDNGTPKYNFCTWKLLTTDPKDSNQGSVTADLNYGATRDDRDYIVLGLGWYEQLSKRYRLPTFVEVDLYPISDICIYQGNSSTSNRYLNYNHYGDAHWQLLGMDLNTNAKGEYLYLMWTTDTGRPPIKELALCIQDENGGPNEKFPGWEVVRYAGSNMWANLNEGVVNESNGKYTDAPALYLVMRRER